ncbi:putative kinase family protein [Blattamonas nauphoetae]|uniref:Kinase family protein n=1 Tax=Blattamonas nauphoetae TaxID=2049346 RepID=A0ABQ9XSA9_9EUKA|nr:putative kinase family protein [Blattamonas nauphoetae]
MNKKLIHIRIYIRIRNDQLKIFSLWVVQPLFEDSCHYLMKSMFHTEFDEASIASIYHGTLNALNYIHIEGHIRRDVKATNILLHKSGNVFLGDFGVSGCLIENEIRRECRNTFVGTPCRHLVAGHHIDRAGERICPVRDVPAGEGADNDSAQRAADVGRSKGPSTSFAAFSGFCEPVLAKGADEAAFRCGTTDPPVHTREGEGHSVSATDDPSPDAAAGRSCAEGEGSCGSDDDGRAAAVHIQSDCCVGHDGLCARPGCEGRRTVLRPLARQFASAAVPSLSHPLALLFFLVLL